jgi:hypothetical protein
MAYAIPNAAATLIALKLSSLQFSQQPLHVGADEGPGNFKIVANRWTITPALDRKVIADEIFQIAPERDDMVRAREPLR